MSLNVIKSTLFCLYLKAQEYHLNVTGQNFDTLHSKFKSLYDMFIDDVDLVSELIRISGQKVSMSIETIQSESLCVSRDIEQTDPDEMIKSLVLDMSILINAMRSVVGESRTSNDIMVETAISDLVVKYAKEKWLLESNLSVK